MMIRKEKLPKNKILMAVILAVVLLLSGLGLAHEVRLSHAQRDFISMLEENAGRFNEGRLVLAATSSREARRIADTLDGSLRITANGRFALVTLPDGVTLADVAENRELRQYMAEFSLDYNDFSVGMEDTDVAADGDIRSNFQTDEPMYPQQTYLDYINVGDSWNVSMGKKPDGEKVVVAVIDSGIDTDHPEFTDADGNRMISLNSYDATDDRIGIANIEDEDGHGTAVAGVIASQINGSGIMGIAPDVELLVIKCDVNSAGEFKSSADIAFGIYYAIEQDVDVINMSFGSRELPIGLQNALQLAVDSDIIPVASAGNESTADAHYPSALDTTIGVGALAQDSWELAGYSNYGINSDIMAPGTTLTAAMGGGYATEIGTSLAAPVVSAAAAIYRSQHPYATFEQVKNDLLAAGKDLGELGEDMYFGFGALDMNAFICEEKGLITYDYCTEDLEATTQVFVKQHTIQTVPQPERENIIFDDWYYDKGYTRVFDYDAWYTTEFVEDVTLYAKWVNEDDEGASVYSYKTLDDGTVEITSYKGKRRYLTVPDEIDGLTVSSIGISAFAGNTRLREIILPKGLTTIKEYAFVGVSRLNSVTFSGDKLKWIGQQGFKNCTSLRQLTLPDSVVTIGKGAFGNCSALTAVEISQDSALEEIGKGAFSKTALSYLYLPANVTVFDGSVLAYCRNMRGIDIHADNTAFVVQNGMVLSADGTTLVYYPAAKTGTLTVPENIISVGDSACTASSVTNVELPESLKKIGAQSFAEAELTALHIPANVRIIAPGAFKKCSRITELTFAENAQLHTIDGDISSGGAFEFCTQIAAMVLPESLEEIKLQGFYGCIGLKALVVPANVKIIEKSAFECCKGLETVSFSENCAVSTIPQYCFGRCSKLNTVNFSDGIKTIEEYAFTNDYLLHTLNFGADSVLSSVGDYSFYSCSALNQMQLPESVVSIGDYAYAFSGLTGVHVPANLTSIGEGAFGACYLLTGITADADHAVYVAEDNVLFSKDITTVYCVPASRIGSYILPDTVKITAPCSFYYDKLLTEVILPEGLQEIQHDSFYSCSSLQSIAIPGTVTNIGRMGFYYCHSLSNVSFGENSQLQRLGLYTFVNCGLSEITIPASVETMAQYVFSNCSEMKRITFASGSKLSYVAAYLLSGTQVEEVIFEDGSALTHLQAHAFDGAQSLKSVDFGDAALEIIDNYAFYNCTNLEQITIPETVTYLGRYAFYGCTGLDRMDIPALVDYIGISAFNGTNSMKVFFVSDTLPANVQAGWDDGITGYFLSAKEFVVTDDWEYILTYSGSAAVVRYTGSASELIIDTVDGYQVEKIGAGCFANHDTLTAVTISAGVREIDNHAFQDSSVIVTISAESILERIGNYAFSNNLTDRLTLPDTVTHIGSGAFEGSGLENLDISVESALRSIGDRAFCGSGIESIYLPASLETVGVEAFENVESLRMVTIADGVTGLKLSNAAFEGSGITDITVPSRVDYIGEYVFGSCPNLESIHVDDGNTTYQDLDGVLLDGNGTALIQYPGGRIGAYEVPAQITVLNYASFKNTRGLTEVTFEEGSIVKTIGWQTFSGCESLTKITIPDTVISFDFYAFENCTSLTEVVLEEGNQLNGVYEGAFYGCAALTDLSLPDTVIDIGDYAFHGCTGLTAFPLSENAQVKGIGDHAFDGCTGITVIPELKQLADVGNYAFADTAIQEFTVSEAVRTIANDAFWNCGSLVNIYCSENNKDFASVDGVLYEKAAPGNLDALVAWPYGRPMVIGEGKTEITAEDTAIMNKYDAIQYIIADSVTKIGKEAFYRYKNITSITIPEQITVIGERAFEGCLSLKHINIPAGITSIGQHAFSGCISLETAGPEGGGYNMEFGELQEIPANAFYGCELVSIVFPESLKSIGRDAFMVCNRLKSVTISSGVTSMKSSSFYICPKLERIEFNATNMTRGICPFVLVGTDTDGIDVIIGKNVKSIPSWLFDDSQVQVLGYSELFSIKSVTFEEGSVCTSIGTDAFKNCERLTSFIIPESVTSMGSDAFAGCTSLTSAGPIGSGCSIEFYWDTAIPQRAFRGHDALRSVIIPDTVTSIGDYAFSDCAALMQIDLPDAVTSLGERAFQGCAGLMKIMIPANVDNIGYNAFAGCTGLKSAGSMGSGCDIEFCWDEVIPFNAFYGDDCLEQIIIPEGITEVKRYAFRGCSKLSYVQLPESLTTFGSNVFAECPNLTTVGPIGSGSCIEFGWKDQIPDYAFAYSSLSGTITIPDGITHIGMYSFAHCNGITSVYLPASVQTVDSQAFEADSKILLVYDAEVLPDSLGTIVFGGNPFVYNVAFFGETEDGYSYCAMNDGTVSIWDYTGTGTELVIPEKIKGMPVVDLNNLAFSKKAITSAVIPASVHTVRTSVFSNCKSLKTITIGRGVEKTAGNAFFACRALETVYYHAANTNDYSYSNLLFAYSGLDSGGITFVFGPEVQRIPAYLTASCSARVKEIQFDGDSSCAQIGNYAFEKCSALPSVTIPASVTQIGTNAFRNCTGLYVVRIDSPVIASSGTSSYSHGYLTAAAQTLVIPADLNLSDYYAEQFPVTEQLEIDGADYVSYSTHTHDWGEPEALSEWSECVSDGEYVYTCGTCGCVKYVIREAHDMQEHIITEVTCVTDGTAYLECTRCGYRYEYIIEAPGFHQFGDWFVAEEAACVNAGVEQRSCRNCMAFETREIPATGHSYESAVIAPTCTEQGFATHTCTVCGDSYVDTYVDALGHDIGEWETVTEATCTEDGTERRDCSRCDHYETRTVEPVGHSYESIVTAPTCTEQGFVTHTCNACGDSYVDTYVDALGHDMGEWKTVMEATCTEDGSEHRGCSRCDHYETRIIAATGHSFGDWFVERSATCIEDGENRRNCANCSHYETEVIPAAGHDYDAVVTEPTCTAQGFTTHTCASCGNSYVDTYVNALGHDMGDWGTVKAATCTESGSERRDCSRCDHYETRTIEATGHSYEAVVTAPTCTEQGCTTHTCANCGDSYVDTYVNALGHDLGEWSAVKEATCTEDGSEQRDCSRCDYYETCTINAAGHTFGAWFVSCNATCTEDGEYRRDCVNCSHYETEVIPAIGHSYESVVTAPTCTEKGFTTHTCTKCGDSYADTYVDALGHDMGEWKTVTEETCTEDGSECQDCSRCDYSETRIIKATGHSFGAWFVNRSATCTEDGENRRNCNNCSHFETELIPATGHDYEAVVTAPTCTEQGCTTHTCSSCGDTYVDSYTAALGHDWDDGVVTVEPTEDSVGEMTYSCERCGKTRTEIIPELEHEHRYDAVVTDPTCTAKGYTTHTCRCGDSYVDTYVDALGHDMGEWVTVTQADCTDDGSERRDCSRCDHSEIRVVNATGHSFGSWFVNLSPTCTEEGENRRNCENCSHYETEAIPATGHDYESVVTAPICTEQGFTTHTCAKCGDSYVDTYVDALGHDMGEWVIVTEASCIETGYERRDCSRCDHYETRTIVATGHCYESVVNDPTCTERGYTTHTCSVCDDTYVDTYVDALGHDLGEWIVVIEATCVEDGQELRECVRCDHYETRIIEAHGHSYESIVTAPTCTEQGYTRYVCSVCDDSYISDYVAPTGHDHEAVVTAPTCTEQGYTTYTCHCGDRYVSDHTAALGHDMGDWETVFEATCTETGEQIRDCSRCDHAETRAIEALGHDWDEGVVTVEPTEEAEGEMTYTCIRCGETRTEAIPELEHEHRYEAAITEPTCTERGFTTYTCRCGDSYVDSYVDALGHDMGEWFAVMDATCTDDGMEQCDCSRCDYHETRVIETTGHDYESVVTEPTCTAQGFTTHTCVNCGDSYTDSYTAALGHSFTEYVSDGNATCTQDGTRTAVCDRCDATDTVIDEGSAHGHDFTEWSVILKPTETAEGLESRCCLRCGVEETRVIAKLENPFNDVAPGSFYYEPVMWAIENGITNGTSATTFGPNDQCMRAHVVTFLWRAVGSPEPTRTDNPFVDVKPSDFYYKPVLWALENGITSGMDATHFGPTAYCNRAQVVTFLYRTMGSPELESAENPFTDVAKGSFYEKPVLWAVKNGITNGLSATSFGPNAICNRAQIVTFLYRAFVTD